MMIGSTPFVEFILGVIDETLSAEINLDSHD